jgi:rhomboid protease GluP
VTQYALIFLVFGLIMPGVDNLAHIGGFAGGYAASAVFNPLTRERGDHMVLAVACLAATFLAVAASVVRGIGLYQ